MIGVWADRAGGRGAVVAWCLCLSRGARGGNFDTFDIFFDNFTMILALILIAEALKVFTGFAERLYVKLYLILVYGLHLRSWIRV